MIIGLLQNITTTAVSVGKLWFAKELHLLTFNCKLRLKSDEKWWQVGMTTSGWVKDLEVTHCCLDSAFFLRFFAALKHINGPASGSGAAGNPGTLWFMPTMGDTWQKAPSGHDTWDHPNNCPASTLSPHGGPYFHWRCASHCTAPPPSPFRCFCQSAPGLPRTCGCQPRGIPWTCRGMCLSPGPLCSRSCGDKWEETRVRLSASLSFTKEKQNKTKNQAGCMDFWCGSMEANQYLWNYQRLMSLLDHFNCWWGTIQIKQDRYFR